MDEFLPLLLTSVVAAIEAATGEVVAEASSAMNSAGELLTQKQAEAKEVATQLSAFADSARKPPSDAVKKMLTIVFQSIETAVLDVVSTS